MIGEHLSKRYRITGELGRGGMGTVYRAYDPVLDRDVAIKVISRVDLGEEAEERFRHEAQVVAGMDHPSIVPIYDLGVEEERLFFVMPVVEGTTLKRWMRQRSFGLDDLLEIAAQVAEGLDYSHQRQVVHRDVKPENVMVSREESGSGDVLVRARVMDFGLALRGASSRLTQSGGVPGTLAYLSPEQILSQEVDGRSDLYSLATILYEGLTGEPPFSGSRYSLLYRIAHEPPRPLDPERVDPALADLVLKCLAKRPAERPERCSEVAAALREMRSRLGSGVRRSTPAVIPVRRPSSSLPLVGREEPLRRLAHRLHETLDGESQLVLIGGEAGMGKTRLLEELAAMAGHRSVAVLRGNFSGEGAFPLHGFGELVQDFFRVRRSGPSGSEGQPRWEDLAADLLRLFPFLQEVPALREAGGTPDPGLSGEAGERTRVYELLARTLLRLAGGEPLVVLLEHLHASEMGAEALGYLLRRLGPSPVLIAATYRGSELDRQHPLAQMLRGSEDPRVERILAAPLAPEEHREFLTSLLPGSNLTEEVQRKLYESSEGNPFFTQELVRWLLESGDLKRHGDGPWHLSPSAVVGQESLPETIRQAVEARLDSLPDSARRVLAAASVLGRSFDFADLEGLVDTDLDEAVDTLSEEGLLEEDPSLRGDRLLFASGIVRDVLYRGLSRRRRRSLHRRCAERLEARYTGRTERVSSRLVHHFSEADDPEKTVHYALVLARDALSGFGSEAAVRALRTALELVEDETLYGGREADLRRYLAAALYAQGHLEAALKEAARAVRTAERTASENLAASAALLAAEISWRGRNIEDTRIWVSRGRELARRSGETGVLRKLLTLGATLANLSGQYAEARAFREEAAAVARKTVRSERAPAPEGPGGGILRTSIPNPLTSFELGKLPTVEEVEVLANVFEPLLSTDADGHLVPHLSTEWRQEEEGRQFRMELREGVTFSDGRTLHAEDVKLSFERTARTGHELAAPVFRALEGSEEFFAGGSDTLSGIEVRSERSVVFRLREPLPIFPAFLTDLRTAVTRRGAGGALLGTGPFRLAGEVTAEEVRLERNPSYWKKPPRLDGVSFRVMTQAADVARALEAGELDVGRDLLPEDLERLLRDERFRSGLREATMKDVYYVVLNGSGPLCSNLDVRRALLGVVRPHDLVWRTLGRFAVPAVGLIPPGILGHDPGRRGPSLSRDEARSLIEGSAVSPPHKLRGIVHPLWLDRFGSLAQALFEQWRRLGIRVEVEEHDLESFLKRTADPQGLDFRLARWALDYEDPDNFTYEMFHSHHGRLRGFVTSSGADTLMEKARTERRPSRRQVLYRQIEDALILEEAGVLPLFHDVSYRIMGPRISRLRMRPSPPWVDYSRVVKGAAAPAPPAPSLVRSAVTLRVPLPGNVESLDPATTFYVDPSEVVPNVFETLVRIDDSAHVVPGLAAELRAEDGSRRFRFRLRSNVRFHDGRRLSVRDVRYSFERLLRVAAGGSEAPLLPIRGARALRAGEATELRGLRIVSQRELLIELEEPCPFFPAMLTCPSAAIVPEGSEHFRESWRSGTAGTGPFRVVSVTPGERIELEAHPHYWRPGYPKCDRLSFEMGFTAASTAAEFRSGRLLLASNLQPDEFERLRRDPTFATGYREAPGISTYYLVLNSRRGVLKDPERRQAVIRALDVEGAVRLLGALAIEAHGLIPPGLPGQTAGLSSRAMEAGGAPRLALSGLKLRALVVPAYHGSYSPLWRHLCRNLREQGVELEETLFKGDDSSNAEFDLVATRWLADFPDSDSFASVLHSRDGVDGSLCGDERIDELIERGRRETDPAVRHATYLRISELARQEALIVPLFHGQIYRFARPEVQGLRLSLRCPEVFYEELSLAL